MTGRIEYAMEYKGIYRIILTFQAVALTLLFIRRSYNHDIDRMYYVEVSSCIVFMLDRMFIFLVADKKVRTSDAWSVL